MVGGRHVRGHRTHVAARGVRARLGLGIAVPALLLGLVWGSGVATASLGSGSTKARTAAVETSASLPFDRPAAGSSSPKRVFAHYVPWFPISLDNKPTATDYYTAGYLTTYGERGAHVAYGGYLRDRPLGRPVSASVDWRILDMETDVREAISAGIDGFAVDLVTSKTTSQVWKNITLLLQAAHNVSPSFTVLLQPDMSAYAALDAPTVAHLTSLLTDYPAAYRLADGRLVISPFLAERKSIDWWTSYATIMATTYGETIALFPVLLNDRAYAASFEPISIGIGNWGNRNPSWNDPASTSPTGLPARIAAVHAVGDMWMQPVSVQDERPNQGVFDEASNTANLRDTWQMARDSGAEWVLLPTWNDYAEGTSIAPSVKHGYAFVDLMAYYIAWWKSGAAPRIVRDGVYVTHRAQPWAARPSYPETKLMSLRGGTPAQDTIEVLAFLTAPATITVSNGSNSWTCYRRAGTSSCLTPVMDGDVTVTVQRADGSVITVTTPVSIDSSPVVQDLQYVAASSLRTGTTSAPLPGSSTAPVSSLTPTPTPTRSSTPTPMPTTPAPLPTSSSPPPPPPPPPPPAPSSTPPSAPSSGVVTTTSIALTSTRVSTTSETRFRVSVVSPTAVGTVQLRVDGALVGAPWPLVSGAYNLGAGLLAAGSHTVVAVFTPADPAAYRASVSTSYPLEVA